MWFSNMSAGSMMWSSMLIRIMSSRRTTVRIEYPERSGESPGDLCLDDLVLGHTELREDGVGVVVERRRRLQRRRCAIDLRRRADHRQLQATLVGDRLHVAVDDRLGVVGELEHVGHDVPLAGLLPQRLPPLGERAGAEGTGELLGRL